MSDLPSSGARSAGRRLAAIVFTDIVGYSARMQRDENGTLALVQADFARMGTLGREHGGEVLNTMGDGMLLCFDSAVHAVACALAMQDEFGRRHAQSQPDQCLLHRVGVHLGDVFRQTSGGVAGDGVNIAARLQTKAPPGGVCISQTVYDTVKGKVPMQALFVGPESFKNITEPIPVWHIAAEGAPPLTMPAGRGSLLREGSMPRSGVAPAARRPSFSDAGGTPALPQIPDFELIRKIGSGSYGDVWLARGLTGAYRAVKIVWRQRFTDAAPFEREFRGLKEFNAHALEATQMALLHVGQDERAGFFYYVMELADDAATGRTIDPARYVPLTAKEMKARRGRLPVAECVAFGVELARSLAGLHARHLLHRDIKPSNVIVVGGVPKLADIGLVASSTEARTFVGTEGYVPPEGPGAPSADVFALGKVLYELATGSDRQVFPQLPETFTDARDRAAYFKLNDVLLRACDPRVERRYRDAAAMLADLEALQAGRSAQRARRWPTLALASAAVAAGFIAYFSLRPAPQVAAPAVAAVAAPKEAPAPKARGIAVLPFENLDAADQAYFAAGVTVEVTQHLSKISALRLMSREAVARFKGGAAELPAMARDLGIGALLTGTVRRADNRVRIGVQLLAAPGGETLWSEQYDREAKDTFAVQTDVAMHVARALQVALPPKERMRIMTPPTENLEAFETYLRAGSKPHPEAIAMFKQAIALDPKFALAYAAMARRYTFLASRTGREDLNRAVESARRAVELDPQMSRAHQALATALLTVGQHDEARLSFQRAIELDQNSRAGLNDLSVLEAQAGRLDQSFKWAKRAFLAAPNLANSFYHVVVPLLVLDDAAAERWLLAGEARFPVDHPTLGHRLQVMHAVLEMRRGDAAAALQRMRNAVAVVPRSGECQGQLTELAVFTGADDARARVDAALKAGPNARFSYSGYSPRTLSAFLWMKAGEREKAQPLIDAALADNRAAMEGGDRSNYLPYENAALQLMRGDRAAALSSLEASYDVGNRDAQLMKVDPLLVALASEPRFVQLLERINADLRVMKARADRSDLDELAKGGKQ